MLLFLTYCFGSLLCGYAAMFLLNKTIPFVERFCLAFLLGFGGATFFIYLMSFATTEIYSAKGMWGFVAAICVLGAASLFVLRTQVMKDVAYIKEAVLSLPKDRLLQARTAVTAAILCFMLVVSFLNYAWGPYDWDVVTLYDFRGMVLAKDHTLMKIYEMTGNDGARFVYYFSYPFMTSIWHAIIYIGGSEFVLLPYAFIYGAFFLWLYHFTQRMFVRQEVAWIGFLLIFLSSDYLLQAQTAYSNFPYTIFFTMGMAYLFASFRENKAPMLAAVLVALSVWVRFVDPFYYLVILMFVGYAAWKKNWRFIAAVLPILIVRQAWSMYLAGTIAPYSQEIQAFSPSSLVHVLSNFTLEKVAVIPDIISFVLNIMVKTLRLPLLLLVPMILFLNSKKRMEFWLEGIWFGGTVLMVLAGGVLFAFIFKDWSGIPGSAERMFLSLPPILYLIFTEMLSRFFDLELRPAGGGSEKNASVLSHLGVHFSSQNMSKNSSSATSEIKLIKSSFYREPETKKALCDFIMGAEILSFSEQCQLFEENFAKYQNRQHAVFVNSGSSANLAILQALLNLGRLKTGDKVAFSALTWSTNAMPIIELGLTPVPVDVGFDTLNISSTTLSDVLEKADVKAVFMTNLLGFCDDIDKIQRICKKEKIILLEDNCESMGTVYKDKKLGNYSLASSFSFYVGHHMSTVEGGMVCTDDQELATMLRLVRAHGWDRNLPLAQQQTIRTKYKVNSSFYSRYTFYDLGYNLRPTELAGFLGNYQLQFADEICQNRNENFLYVAPKLYSQTEKYFPVRYDHIDFVSNFAVPVVCRTVEMRDKLVKACNGKVEIRPIVGGDMTQQPFFAKYAKKYLKFTKNANSTLIHQQGLYFGNNPELTKAELDTIVDIFVDTN